MASSQKEPFEYSDKYEDSVYEYRHVIVSGDKKKQLPRPMRLFTEAEWRKLGVTQSLGWEHYAIHIPEPNVLLFRRKLGTDPVTGKLKENK